MGLHAMEAGRYLIPRGVGDALVVAISASGETARPIEVLTLANEMGATTLAITENSKSSLATTATGCLALELPEAENGPGLISYLASLLAGYALAAAMAPQEMQALIDGGISLVADQLPGWIEDQREIGKQFATRINPNLPIEFLGSGPQRGSAMFAAAKVLEAAGQSAWAQDVEEWAHLEYFSDPSELPVWLLGASGRSATREREVEQAARQIGRDLVVTEWGVAGGLPDWMREDLAALALWAGPVAYADAMMERLEAEPFRGFRGGRSRAEGGGPSRIRSSVRLNHWSELSRFDPRD